MATGWRHFGNVRKLPSGRWQASYWHDGERHLALDTFPTKYDAQAFPSIKKTDILRGEVNRPRRGQDHLRPARLGTGC